ncbi:hypothetical protein EJB05_08147, partial [Eragrostis curvula]
MAAPALAPQPPTTRAGEGGGATPEKHGAGAEARRAVKALLLFLAAVALPCLVMYSAVAPGAFLVRPPWPLAAPENDVGLLDLENLL